MESRFQNPQPPMFDPNSLDENYEIVYDYDENGNLRRVRKVRRYEITPMAYFLIGLSIVIFFIIIQNNYGQ
jgi:hypothetical protein